MTWRMRENLQSLADSGKSIRQTWFRLVTEDTFLSRLADWNEIEELNQKIRALEHLIDSLVEERDDMIDELRAWREGRIVKGSPSPGS